MLAAAALLTVAALVVMVERGHSTGRPQPQQSSASVGQGASAADMGASPVDKGASASLSARHLAAPGHVNQRSVDKVLHYTSYVGLAGHRCREVALTFDDGPGHYTSAILHVLRATHAPATFFVIGRWARAYPKLVAAEVHGGFEVGDHTATHPFMSMLSSGAQGAQIAEAADAIVRDGAPYPRLFRPPYGAFDPSTLALLRAKRMLMVLWSVDTSDYARPGVSRIVYAAVSGARPGAVILMHDGGGDRSETVAALTHIIKRLRARGFRFVTVAKLLANDPPPRGQPPPRPLSGPV